MPYVESMFVTFNIEGLEISFCLSQTNRAIYDSIEWHLIKIYLKHSCRLPDFIQSFFNKGEDKKWSYFVSLVSSTGSLFLCQTKQPRVFKFICPKKQALIFTFFSLKWYYIVFMISDELVLSMSFKTKYNEKDVKKTKNYSTCYKEI